MPKSPDQSPEPDPDVPYWPFGSEPDEGAGEAGDETRVQGPAAGSPDATAVQRPAAGETSVQPPVQDAPRWSARAHVPSPGDPSLRRAAPQEWVEEEDPYHGRSWFAPVVISVVALVLVAALSVGVWLIYRATANGENAPVGEATAPSATSSSAVPLPSTAPTTEAEPSSPSSEAPPSSAAPPAAPVAIPPLRGDTLAEATVKLQVLGLNVTVERKADGSLPPGEVLSTRPGEGEMVTPGDTVTLIVATAPLPAPSSTSPSPSAS